jgi:serine/threonine protein kinase
MPEQEFTGNDRFQVIRRLGEGGMGAVYEVFDREYNGPAALKVLRHLTPDGLFRFKYEFRDFQNLVHPNLIRLGEMCCFGDIWCFTMELIPDAMSFLEYVRPGLRRDGREFVDTLPIAGQAAGACSVARDGDARGVLDEGRLRDALLQVARGICAVHEHGKVHRDIKPSNVLVGANGRTVVIDFGVAANLGAQGGPPEARSSEAGIVGTPHYMAPEQATAERLGPEADWYAVGMTLFEALTGRLPVLGDPHEIIRAKKHIDGFSPKNFNPNAPDDLASLCSDLLRFEPRDRPSGPVVLSRLEKDPNR